MLIQSWKFEKKLHKEKYVSKFLIPTFIYIIFFPKFICIINNVFLVYFVYY